eukprot:6293831-Prorocentrum_lima.AAC.1
MRPVLILSNLRHFARERSSFSLISFCRNLPLALMLQDFSRRKAATTSNNEYQIYVASGYLA